MSEERKIPDARRLVHELEVHQEELRIQNEELRRAREEMEAALARYRTLFESAPVGYAALGRDGVIREINHAGARLLRRDRLQLAGQPLSNMVSLADREQIEALLQRAHYRGAREGAEVKLLRPSGESFFAVVTAAPMQDRDGTILLAFEDVSERRAREAELERAERALREADRRKDEFLAALSHELRNPLAPVRNCLYVLGRAEPGGDKAKKALAIMDRQVTHLSRLVDDLLDVTRIARGKVQLQPIRLELGELLRRTIEDHRESFEADGLHLEARLDAGPLFVQADPARLVQVLSNLLGNAAKFTPRGGTVTVGLAREGDAAEVRIHDTGAGIAPEVLAHLFEPFAQAPQTIERSRGGLGLGLAMVKGLVELHGGRVHLASEGPGRGSEVRFTVPLDTGEARAATPDALPRARGRRVLVIEDHADAAESLRTVLAVCGHDVAIAGDGPAGLERARETQPEVVICDIGLPGMDGYAVARALRADEALRHSYLIALSGYARPEDQRRAVEAGFDRHVAKPVDPRMLDRLLAEAPGAA